jgi:enolase-phosphatase E1
VIKAILMDIEGTTSSLSFVRDVLFPYSRERMADFIGSYLNDIEVRKLLDDARAVADQQLNNEQLIQQLLRWVDEDRKVTPLKSLQGLIWGQGYQRGDFHGHIYEDAARKLKNGGPKASNCTFFLLVLCTRRSYCSVIRNTVI